MFEREKNIDDLKSFDIQTDTQNNDSNNDNELSDNEGKGGKIFKLLLLAMILLIGFGIYHFIYNSQTSVQTKETQDSMMFVPLDEITINLRNGSENNASWLRVKITLEVNGQANHDAVSKMTPKIIDVLQTYLKELRKNDLDGSFGLYKIKDEMLLRINTILYPNKIEAILFQEIIIQTL